MSYGFRNTLLLLLVLIMIAVAGFGSIRYVQQTQINELTLMIEENREQYDQMSATAEMFPVFEEALQRAESFIDSYNKSLFPTNDPDQIYRYLIELNLEWPRVEFNYNFNDSTQHGEYGIVRSTISGSGSWRGVYNFINRIENSRPIQRVDDLQITPINQVGEYGNTNFQFVLRSHYTTSGELRGDWQQLAVVLNEPDLFYNPYYPLIRNVEPNEDNLTDVERSRLIGLSSSRAFLRNQNGDLVRLSPNDTVYLGRLQQIEIDAGQAIFILNKGGITEEIILEVDR